MKLLITVIIYALFIAYLLGAVLYFIGNKSGKKRALSTASLMVKIGLVLNIAALICLLYTSGAGGGIYMLKASDNPEFCSSCHIMEPYYESWNDRCV